MWFEFETEAMLDAGGRISMWGVTLPAWIAFTTLHVIDEGVDRGTGQAWYRAGTLGRYTLQRIVKGGTRVQPQFDDMLVVAPPKLVVATFPGE